MVVVMFQLAVNLYILKKLAVNLVAASGSRFFQSLNVNWT
jgi:hypothetical protein